MKKQEINLEGKTVVVTGATGIIGRAIVRHYLGAGATVIMAIRNLETAGKFLNELKEENANARILIMKLDVSCKNSIIEFAKKLGTDKTRVDYFVHNAGILNSKNGPTKEGLEIHYATNYFGQIYLTQLLLETFNQYSTKVIFQSSLVYKARKIDWKNVQNFSGTMFQKYARIKRLLNLTVAGIEAKNEYPNVEFVIVHPGVCGTDIFHYKHGGFPKWMYRIGRFFCKLVFHSPKTAALPAFVASFTKVPAGYQVAPKGIAEIWGKPKVKKLRKSVMNPKEINRAMAQYGETLKEFNNN